MTSDAQPWLPAEVVFSSAARARIKEVLAGWSADWFASHTLTIGRSGVAAGDSSDQSSRAYTSRFAKILVPDSSFQAVGWALDAPIDKLELKLADMELVLAFEEAIFNDLAGRITNLFNQAAASPDSRPGSLIDLWIENEVGDARVLIRIPRSAVIALSKSQMPPRRAKGKIPGRLKALFGSVPVTIRAGIGSTLTPVSELRNLARGDVLVLDRRVDQGVVVYLPTTHAPIATAAMTPDPTSIVVSKTAAE